MLPSEPHDAEFDPQEEAKVQLAFSRTNLPGICLIIVGTLNLILGSVCVVRTFQFLEMDPKELVAEFRKALESDVLDKKDPEEIKETFVGFTFTLGGANVVFGILTITAGMFMRTLRNYRLTLAGAVLTAVPGLSLLSCLVIGIAAGLWATLVLLRPEVKSAFV